jgi:hypothetical protein
LALGALGWGLPIIAIYGGDYQQSRSQRPQEQSLFASFSSEKEVLSSGA